MSTTRLRGDQEPPKDFSDAYDLKDISQSGYVDEDMGEFHPIRDWLNKKSNIVTAVPSSSFKLNHFTTSNQFSYARHHKGGGSIFIHVV